VPSGGTGGSSRGHALRRESDPDTDAYDTFHGIASAHGVIYYGDSAGTWIWNERPGPLKTYTLPPQQPRRWGLGDSITRFRSPRGGGTNASTSGGGDHTYACGSHGGQRPTATCALEGIQARRRWLYPISAEADETPVWRRPTPLACSCLAGDGDRPRLRAGTSYNDCAWEEGNRRRTSPSTASRRPISGLLVDHAPATIPCHRDFFVQREPHVQTGPYGGAESDRGRTATILHTSSVLPASSSTAVWWLWVELNLSGWTVQDVHLRHHGQPRRRRL
jgi:hypothetical protein